MRFLLRSSKTIKTINCSEIIKAMLKEVDGRGGGRPDMAQGNFNVSGKNEIETLLTKNLESHL